MKKTLYLFIIAISLLTACGPQLTDSVNNKDAEAIEAEELIQTEIIVTDALGREVVFKKHPEKIIVAGKLRPMIVDFLYLFESSADKIIAIEAGGQSSENFLKVVDEDIESKYVLEKGAGAEQIAPLEPDLVILKSSVKENLGDQLELINIPVVYIDFETVDQIYRDIRILGSVLGENERAEDVITEYKTLYTEFEGYTGQANDEKSTVIMQISASEQEYAYEIPSTAYLQSVMVADAGGKVIWDEAAQAGGWSEINIEQLNVWDPNFLFVINYKGNARDIVADLKNSQPFGSLRAVANEQIFAFPFDHISWDQPDPRWILGYSWLVYKLNPQTVSQERMIDVVSSFYQDFYRLSEKQVNEQILPRIVNYF